MMMQKMIRGLKCAAVAVAMVSLVGPAHAQSGPEEAPKGQKWMNCGFNYLRGYQSGYVMGGPWLVSLPEDVTNDALNALGEKFAAEYAERQMTADLPGVRANGPGRCAINQSLSDRRYYAANAEKAPGYYHTTFKPSFAK